VMEQLRDDEWPTGDNQPLLLMLRSPRELAETFGLVFVRGVDDLGDVEVAAVRGTFGVAGLVRYADAPFEGTTVFVDVAADFEATHRAVVDEFGLTDADLGWARLWNEDAG